jgi:vitamin B12/bleomycin/antimicrobial peptide transport system ATP-binding/permease protein
MQVQDGFFTQFVRLAGPYWSSKNRFAIRRDTVSIIVLTVMQIYLAVVITQWNAALFDALEQRSMSGLISQLGMLVLIFIANIAISTKHLIVKRRLMIGWRLWLTDRVVSKWMHKGRHYQMTILATTNHDNPDGRIAEDIHIATEEAIGLVHSFFYSLLLLGSFTAILWNLSGTVEVDIWLFSFSLSGYLVWIAIAYSACASVLGWWMGKPLTQATHFRQTQEAQYRHALIKAQENSEAIAIAQDECNEKTRLSGSFHAIIATFQQQTAAWKQIQIFTSGYSIVSMALPILTVSPRYIVGSITLGTLMQSIQAFEQMVSALSWPVNNIAQIAKWRASVERVLGLVNAVDALDHSVSHQNLPQVAGEMAKPTTAITDNVTYGNFGVDRRSTRRHNEIKIGELVLVSGDNSLGGKTV